MDSELQRTSKKINMWNSGFKKLYFACFIGFLNSAINGYDLSLMTSLIVLNPFIEVFGKISKDTDPNFLAWFIGLLQLGSVIGTIFVGPLTNWLGRVKSMAFGSCIIISGAILEVFPQKLLWLQVGRFMIGFGVVFVTTAAPTYVVEIAHPIFRGRAGAAYNTGWSVGAIPAAVITWGMAYVDTNLAWQLPLLIQCAFSGVVLLGCFVIPESPRWLMANGKNDEAREFFIKYHADGDASDPIVQEQMGAFQEILGESSKTTSNFFQLFQTKALRYQMMLLLFVAFFTQYAGNYVSGYYLTQITPFMGVPASDKGKTLLFNVITSVIGCAAGFAGAAQGDNRPRRSQLMLGATVCGIAMLGLTIFCGIYDVTGVVAWGIVAFVFIQFFSISYSFCYTPLQSLYCVEILDYKNRATGMAFEQLLVNIVAYVQNFILANGAGELGYKFFGFYVGVNALAFVTYWKLFPETKGRTLEEIEQMFQSENGPVATSLAFSKNDISKQ